MKVESVINKNEKPRIRFCHGCSKKLYGNHHAIVRFEDVDHDFIYHKDCGEELKKPHPAEYKK